MNKDVSEEMIETELKTSAKDARNQIDRKQYITDMKQEGIRKFLKIGIAFHKKQVQMVSEIEENDIE